MPCLPIFIYGGSSILQKLSVTEALQAQVSFLNIATIFPSIAAAILLLPIKIIDYINRVMFIGLLAIVAILILGLFTMIDWTDPSSVNISTTNCHLGNQLFL